jgi:hypothetical protein
MKSPLYSFLGITLFLLPTFTQCGFDTLTFLGTLSESNKQILEQRESKRIQQDIIRRHDLTKVNELIAANEHKLEWRLTKAIMQWAKGDEAASKKTMEETVSLPEYQNYASEARMRMTLSRMRLVRDAYQPGSPEYARANSILCRNLNDFNESEGPAGQLRIPGC